MSKDGKMNKIKRMIKRWNSSSRIDRTSGCGDAGSCRSQDDDTWHAAAYHGDKIPAGFYPVYVGKSRRRYFVSSGIVDNPLFQNLVERSAGTGETIVGCEVVLFEHLLWMLDSADPQSGSLDDLVHFYAC
ncbi:hypothetical protein KSP40_PGU015581 [Platanthera guangdongensis]|uniref:Uncharacterized protein n=1 Tax=Platanthera guangdongensis TaxID=2320717 RepID=A0ABR2LQU6_9ASPA